MKVDFKFVGRSNDWSLLKWKTATIYIYIYIQFSACIYLRIQTGRYWKYFSCTFLFDTLMVNAWLTQLLFGCLRGWDKRPDEDPEPGASESWTLSQQTWSRALGRHPLERRKQPLLLLVSLNWQRGRAEFKPTHFLPFYLQSEQVTCRGALCTRAAHLTTGFKSVSE